uniref:Uncharacterized protein n=1 Tax=Arundo donax TaxID=35708 RepID=A0A0A9BDN2_ARUDO
MDLSYSLWKASKIIAVYTLLACTNIGVLILILGIFFLASNLDSSSLFLFTSTVLSKCFKNLTI